MSVQVGHADVWLHLGQVHDALTRLTATVGSVRVLLDEWNSIPPRLQPYLADLLRRLLWNTAGCVVKVSVVEAGTRFATTADGAVIGLPQSDLSTLVIDHYLGSLADRRGFLGSVIFEHTRIFGELDAFATPEAFLSEAFVPEAFDLVVEASEGNPQHALMLAARAAEAAGTRRLAPEHVHSAIRALMFDLKDLALLSNDGLVHWIEHHVLASRESRCFCVAGVAGRIPERLRDLYQAQWIHRDRIGLQGPHFTSLDEWHVDYSLAHFLVREKSIAGDENRVPPVRQFSDLTSAPTFRSEDWQVTRNHSIDWEALEPPIWVRAARDELEPGEYILIDTGLEVATVPLQGSPLTVGRGDCDIRIQSRFVSRQHARLVRNSGVWRIVDTESTNGVLVKGIGNVPWHELADGDACRLGHAMLYFVRAVDA